MQTASRPTIAPPALGDPLRRAVSRAHLALPGLVTAGYAFRAGGFFPLSVGIGALALCLLIVLRITLAEHPFAGWSRGAAVAALAGAGFASWTLLSALWSHAPERALLEFDRALLYAATFLVMALTPRRPGDLAIVLRWVVLALVAACVAGLASRLAPDVFPISSRFVAERLSFPLTYWNAMGLASGLACVLALHCATGGEEPPWARVAASAALPVTAVALYFTFSRGAIAATVVGGVAYLALAPTRRVAFALAAALLPLAVALYAAWHADALATAKYFAGDGPLQGHHVAVVLAACVVVAAGLRLALLRLEERTMARRPPRVSRSTLVRGGAAALILLVSVLVILGVPGRIRDEARTFGKSDFVTETGDARDRLTRLDANGRPDLWRASLQAFDVAPVLGTGAGTFTLTWQQRRAYFWEVTDGHSLYLEVLGELGLVGAALLLVFLLTPLALALRRLTGIGRHANAAFLAAGTTLLLHAAIDWDWEMPAVFAWFFGAAGVVVAAPALRARGGGVARLPRVVAGIACLVVAVTPALVAASQSQLDRATIAFDRRDCPVAVDAALGALATLQRAAAHEIVGYCDLRSRQNGLALRAMAAAHRADPDNWRYLYGLAVAQALSGRDPRAAADAALRRNPHEELARSLARAMRSPSVRKRYQAAARARIPAG